MPGTQKRKIVLCLLRAQHATKWLCVIVVVYLVFEMFDLILTVEHPILCNMTIKLIFFPFLLPYLFIFPIPAFLFSPPLPDGFPGTGIRYHGSPSPDRDTKSFGMISATLSV